MVVLFYLYLMSILPIETWFVDHVQLLIAEHLSVVSVFLFFMDWVVFILLTALQWWLFVLHISNCAVELSDLIIPTVDCVS